MTPCLVCGNDIELTTKCVPLISPNADEDGTVLMAVVCSDCFEILEEAAVRIHYREVCELALQHTVSMS